MHFKMSFRVLFCVNAILTILYLLGLKMHFRMSFKGTVLGECLLTYFTFVRLLSSMYSNVSCHHLLRSKYFPTERTCFSLRLQLIH